MEIKVYKPKNALLRQHIECFYTLRRKPEDKNTTYVTFPSVFSMVCLNANSQIESRDAKFTFVHRPNAPFRTSLFCNFDHLSWNTYQGQADEIVIYFKPLGINSFIEKDLNHHMRESFVEFAPFEDYRSKMIDVFSMPRDEDRIEALEEYWLSQHRGFQHSFLTEVVADLTSEDSSPVSALAQQNGISRATLDKHFGRHLCTTPSQFKKVARFRHAIKRFRHKTSKDNLADISYYVDYFDQSHMIKDFRSLTKYSPKTFFSKISTFGDGQINWLFL